MKYTTIRAHLLGVSPWQSCDNRCTLLSIPLRLSLIHVSICIMCATGVNDEQRHAVEWQAMCTSPAYRLTKVTCSFLDCHDNITSALNQSDRALGESPRTEAKCTIG